MSLMRRIWNFVRNPVRYAGKDLEGNRYYERRSPTDPERTKRTVEYYDPEDMWKYIGSGKQLPVQWSSWLTHTRQHPPTLEELESDLARQRRVLENVNKIEARDRAEAEKMKRIRQQEAHLAVEEAVVSREQRSVDSATSEKPHLGSEVPIRSSKETTTKVLPPKFVTPLTPRKSRSSKPYAIPPTDMESDPTQAANSGRDVTDPSTMTTETESWTPKARKRG